MPQRGEKAELVENAARNARESLARRMAESATQARLLAGLGEAFDLPGPPRRIEVFDNSHIQGSHPVGGMIVAGPEGFIKSQYRKFNIKGTEIAPGDDFGMMREVLTRRFKRLLEEDPDREGGTWPDLLLIDGGAGQVSTVAGILADLASRRRWSRRQGHDRNRGRRIPPPGRALRAADDDPVIYFVKRCATRPRGLGTPRAAQQGHRATP